MRPLRRHPLAPAIVLAGALALTAPATAAPASNGADADTEFSIAAHLAEIPAELLDGNVWVTIADVDAAVALAGVRAQIAHHPDDLRIETLAEWIGPITGLPIDRNATPPTFAPVFVPFPAALPVQFLQLAEETAAQTGWSIADVSSFAAVDVFPGPFAVIRGDFDDTTLSPTLTDVGDGIVSLGAGDELAPDMDNRNALNAIGVPVRMAQRDGAIALSASTSSVASWLAGPAASAADVPSLAAIAAELDAADARSAVFGPMSPLDPSFLLRPDVSAADAEELVAALTEQALPATVTDVGIGWGVDADGRGFVVLAYFTLGDAATAATQLETLFATGDSLTTGRPLAELLTLDEVRTGDATVTAILRPVDGRSPTVALDMYVQRELPFVTAG